MRRALIGLGVLLLGGGAWAMASSTPTRRRASARIAGVAAIGDSLTEQGAYLREVHSALGTSGRAIGLRGAGAAKIAEQMQYVLADGVDVVVVLAGVNDIASGRSVETITTALEGMYAQARAAGVQVVAVPILPWGRYMQIPRLRARAAQLQRDTNAVNAWIRAAGVPVVNIGAMGDGARLRPEFDSGDGLHLSAAGQRRLGQLIAKAIQQWN